jgi:hypothetical protein
MYAIKYLPEEYFTPEIVEAVINLGDVEALNYLPSGYLTSENISALIEKGSKSWRSFDLEKIPVHFRTEKVCSSAVKSKKNNYQYVPDAVKTQEITDEIIGTIGTNMQLLEYIPRDAWNEENVYNGLSSIYSQSNYQYSKTIASFDKFRQLQVLLAHVPAKIKNRRFYSGLFSATTIPAQELQSIIPHKYKNESYYLLLAEKDFSQVPADKYSREIFLAAMKSRRISIGNFFRKGFLNDKFFSVLDDKLADAVVERFPQYFEDLPVRFLTVERLLFTIESNPDYSSYKPLTRDKSLLTKPVCEALVKLNRDLPEFPDEIWDEDFVNYCQSHPSSFKWFEQMPQRFQTQETVNRALKHRRYYIQYVHPSFINSRLAMSLYRDDKRLKNYLPEKFFADFTAQTGLPEEFFGGETTFMELKNEKRDYTCCQIGNSYIGFYRNDNYRDAASYVIMTRATSQDTQPEVVFNRRVGSFHKTWLEKMIADYDRDFIKPAVGKSLKEVQLSPYYGVEAAGKKDDILLYRNTFRGETVAFVAKKGNLAFSGDTREAAVSQFKEKVQYSEAS